MILLLLWPVGPLKYLLTLTRGTLRVWDPLTHTMGVPPPTMALACPDARRLRLTWVPAFPQLHPLWFCSACACPSPNTSKPAHWSPRSQKLPTVQSPHSPPHLVNQITLFPCLDSVMGSSCPLGESRHLPGAG